MTPERSTAERREALRVLGRMVWPHRGALAVGLLATVGVVAMRLALPWPLRGIVETVFPMGAEQSSFGFVDEGGRSILILCGMYVVLAAGTGAFEWVQRLWMARVAGRTTHDLRVHVVSRLKPAHDRTSSETADLITRVIGDIARIRADLKGILIHLGQNGLLLLAITVLFLILAPVLGLLFLVSGLLAVGIGYRAVESVARVATRHRRKESEYAAAIQDEDEEGDDPSSSISASSTKKDVRITRIIGRSTLLVHLAVAATVSLALWLGVRDVRAGTLAPGELFLFIAYAITIQRRAVTIGRQVARSGKLLANTGRLARLIRDAPKPDVQPAELRTAIRLAGVEMKRFVTQKKASRLGPVTLEIPQGQRLLVLGAEGSGKSSLLSVLAGRLQARRGSLHWDDEDLIADTEAIRASVAYLSDEPHFGRVSVRRWLGLPAERDPDEATVETLRTLGAWTVIRRLRGGLGQRLPSSHLSPRERRALSLARVVLSDAPVWILDNPVDTDRAKERGRLEAVLERGAGRTIVVALRSPVIPERFDRVLIVKRGVIEFDGTPAQWSERRRQRRAIRAAPSRGH